MLNPELKTKFTFQVFVSEFNNPHLTHQEKISVFMKRFLENLIHILDNGFVVDDKTMNIFNYDTVINNKIINNNWNDDAISQSCQKLFNQLYDSTIAQTDINILKYFNIDKKPVTVLYNWKSHSEPTKYVRLFGRGYLNDEDHEGSHREEIFYGSGASNTREEFEKEAREVFKDTGFDIVDVSEVYEHQGYTLYEYLGSIYKIWDI